jgi:hypothetical protein
VDSEDAIALEQIGRARAAEGAARAEIPKYLLGRRGIQFAILGAGLVGVWLTLYLTKGSFAQSVMSNVASTLLVFLTVAPTLRAMHVRPRTTLFGGACLSALLLLAAWKTCALFRSAQCDAVEDLLVNGAVGFLFVLVLDMVINRWLDAIAAAEGDARRRIEEAAKLVEQANSALDYKYAVHDYLNLPRPDKLGGITLDDGEPLLGVMGWPTPKDS